MGAASAFGRGTLLSLARLRDPIGIVSIYVDAHPERRGSRRPGWDVAVKNELCALRRRVRTEGPRQRWVALAECLDGLESELSLLLDRKETGRGWAIFAPVAEGDVSRVALQLPLPDRVVFEETAFVGPLVGALDAGWPAGIVTVSRSGLGVVEWSLGEAEALASFAFDQETGDWREMKGPAGANPAMAQQTAPQRDRFERRMDDRRLRFLATVGARLGALARGRRWDRLLVAGDPRLAQALAECLPTIDLEVVLSRRALEARPPHELAAAVAPELEEAKRGRDAALVERALSAGHGGGPATLGLSDTSAALSEGRVMHLLLDQSREHRGTSAPEGLLVPEGEAPPGIPASDLRREPDLAERMIEHALETGARVTPIEGDAAAMLAPAGGVAALLRW